MDLVDSVIANMKLMPRVEFDLKRQMQRAAISIPANIAEGGDARRSATRIRTMSRSRWDRKASFQRSLKSRFETACFSARNAR